MRLERGPGRGNWVCLYINLDRREDRKEKLLKLLGAVPWLRRKLRRLAAVDGRDFDSAAIQGLEGEPLPLLVSGAAAAVDVPTVDLRGGGFSCHLSRGAIGCALSHRQAWEKLLELRSNGIEWALVLEDDIVALAPDFETRLADLLSKLPSDFDVCYVGYHGATPDGDPLRILRCGGPPGPEVHGTFGYLVSTAGAQKLLHGSPWRESPFPLAIQLDSAMSRVLGGLKAWRVARGAALLCSPPSQLATSDTDCQIVCHCGRCFAYRHTLKCSVEVELQYCEEDHWRPSSDGSSQARLPAGKEIPWADFEEFLAVLRKLAMRPPAAPAAPAAAATMHAPWPPPSPCESPLPLQHLDCEWERELRRRLSLAEVDAQHLPSSGSLGADVQQPTEEDSTVGAGRMPAADPLQVAEAADKVHRDCNDLESPSCPLPPPSPAPTPSREKLDVMDEVQRISLAKTPGEILMVPEDADDAALQKAWKRLIFALHPDKLSGCSEEEKISANTALHAVHRARDEFRESAQACGLVDVPETPVATGRPVCTRNVPGQRRYECRWEIPTVRDMARPVHKYEVYGPRIFAHTGEPMEWVLLATLPKIEGVFILVEESPTQQEVMWAGDRARAPTVPLTVYAVNGRGRSEALYVYLPWQGKFPWLQGNPSMICRQCCTVQCKPRKGGEKFQCSSCDNWLSTGAAAIVLRCPKCAGEVLWDNNGARLDCRLCGRSIASGSIQQHRQAQRSASTPPVATAGGTTRAQSNGGGAGGGGRRT